MDEITKSKVPMIKTVDTSSRCDKLLEFSENPQEVGQEDVSDPILRYHAKK